MHIRIFLQYRIGDIGNFIVKSIKSHRSSAKNTTHVRKCNETNEKTI